MSVTTQLPPKPGHTAPIPHNTPFTRPNKAAPIPQKKKPQRHPTLPELKTEDVFDNAVTVVIEERLSKTTHTSQQNSLQNSAQNSFSTQASQSTSQRDSITTSERNSQSRQGGSPRATNILMSQSSRGSMERHNSYSPNMIAHTKDDMIPPPQRAAPKPVKRHLPNQHSPQSFSPQMHKHDTFNTNDTSPLKSPLATESGIQLASLPPIGFAKVNIKEASPSSPSTNSPSTDNSHNTSFSKNPMGRISLATLPPSSTIQLASLPPQSNISHQTNIVGGAEATTPRTIVMTRTSQAQKEQKQEEINYVRTITKFNTQLSKKIDKKSFAVPSLKSSEDSTCEDKVEEWDLPTTSLNVDDVWNSLHFEEVESLVFDTIICVKGRSENLSSTACLGDSVLPSF
ncbi:hypothetical protein EIN_059080 [Entamoeba invadens IP1]|uniref:hypothetical protein n=1 Tax=Entamoeba invadens IP1 TaxID=370355 RepID=UPI0002C3F3B2|nr:hypothetical protein EIN_059080 [Entamoeba invadens IP1]ELP93443.1 hypothetical protein EIN_059080 [Entamoeba invadens IP1]|eukprot:XP_004260214.1 hypothetical protein EIN_059080 [Entamoeba invadens IP1]